MGTTIIQQSNELSEVLNLMAGFVLALLLFYVQERLRSGIKRRQTKAYCLKEITYDITLFETLIETTNRVKQEIAVGNQTVYFDFSPSNVLYKFTADAHAEGILFDKLDAEEIAKYNSELSFFDQNLTNYISSKITEYQNGQLNAADMISTIQWVEDKAKETIKTLRSIRKKLTK